MPTLIETLTSYVPTLITRRLAADPAPISLPTADGFSGAILFADLAGFTALTEHLSQQGPHGVELLAQVLNRYFDRIIDLITAYGGDVVKFAGDSLLAYWPTVEQPHPGYLTPHDTTTAMRYATQCAALIQSELKNYETMGMTLRLRTSLGVGHMVAMHLGGVFDRAELIILGSPIIQIKLADAACQPGEVTLSPQAWELMQPYVQAEPISDQAMRLQNITSTLPLPRPTRFPELPLEAKTALQPYIPAAIFNRLMAGQTQWLAELSIVTTIFINLPDLTPKTTLDEAQTVMCELQNALYRYEGSINKLNVDEKGITMVAVLGLPPLIHSDDAARGVRAALDIQAKLQALGLGGSIGITTGRAFCGTIGSSTRCEYTMHGDVINLSARLMQIASKLTQVETTPINGGSAMPLNEGDWQTVPILCDETTYQAAARHALFEPLPQVAVKGKEQTVKIYRPISHIKRYYRSRTLTGLLAARQADPSYSFKSLDDLRPKAKMIGQLAERQFLSEQIQGLLIDYAFQNKHPRVVIIEGMAGIGKSKLIGDLIEQAESSRVTHWVGAANAIERTTPYHAWYPMFNQIFKLDMLPHEPRMRREYILNQIVADFGLSKVEVAQLLLLAPLLKAVIPLDLPENDITIAMTNMVRAENTRQVLLSILHAITRQNPTLLIMEDVHWLDSASWALAEMVIESQLPLLLVMTTRPSEEAHRVLPHWQISNPFLLARTDFLNFLTTKKLAPPRQLAPLSVEETLQLVCQRLYVSQLPPELETVIFEKAAGHPFFSEELAYMLRDLGLITVRDGQCKITSTLTAPLPDTIEAVIASRISRLIEPEQLALKVASVMGRIFQFQLLLDIYPIENDKTILPEAVHHLTELDILSLETPMPELAYLFKHTITQEVVYQRLVQSQREQLHRAVAEWYELTQIDNLAPFYSLLAYHWGQANVILKQGYYLEQTAQQALANGAYQEAVEAFKELLALEQPVSPMQVVLWERQLAQAYFDLGQLPQSRHHLERTVKLLGWPMPTHTVGLWRQLIAQISHRIKHYNTPPSQPVAMLEAARAYEQLAHIAYFSQEKTLAFMSVLQGLNLAEAAGAQAEIARSLANLTLAVGILPMPKLAQSYNRQARALAHELQEPAVSAWVLMITATYELGLGHWQSTQNALAQALPYCEQLKDHRHTAQILSLTAMAAYHQGQFVRSGQIYAEIESAATQYGDSQAQAWGLVGQALNLWQLGQLTDIAPLLHKTLPMLAHNLDQAEKLRAHALLALVYLQQNNLDQADAMAAETTRLMENAAIGVVKAIKSYVFLAQFYLTRWAQEPHQAPKWHPQAHLACQRLQQVGRVFPIARPRAAWAQGHYDWLMGQPIAAHKQWQRSLNQAQHLAMPHEAALAHQALGQHLPLHDPARQEHLRQACQIFSRLASVHDLTDTLQIWLQPTLFVK